MNPFAFSLGTNVVITASGETGEVIGRAEYLTSEPSYFVRYRASDGRAVQQWWEQSALHSAA